MDLRLVLVVLVSVLFWAGSVRADSDGLSQYLDRGHALAKDGKHEQALPYLLLALELGEAKYAKNAPDLAPLLDTLAETYSAQGSFTDAEPLLERSLTIQEQALANNQRGIARTLASLGFVYQSTGRPAEAGKLYNRVLAVWQPKLGDDDPSVRAAREALAKLSLAKATPGTMAAAPLPTAAGPSGAFGVHLTSIRNPKGVDREWGRLQHEYPKLLAGTTLTVRKVDLGGARGVFYRIQGGALSKREAQDRCLEFAKRAVWCRVVEDGGQGPLSSLPLPKMVSAETAVASAEAPARAGFRIHLTSIRDADRADQEWRRLRQAYPALLLGLDLAVERADLGVSRGVYYRIEGGPLSHAAAQDLCRKFAALSVWCGIVPPANGTADSPQGQLLGRSRPRGTGDASATRYPYPPRRRRIDRSMRGTRPEPGTRRKG